MSIKNAEKEVIILNNEIKKAKGRPKKEKNYNSPFAVRLRELAGNKTNQEIADGVGVSRQTIGQFILGKTYPDINTLVRLADYFEVTTDYLLCITDYRLDAPTITNACETTGLSEDTILMLCHYSGGGKEIFDDIASDLLVELEHIANYKQAYNESSAKLVELHKKQSTEGITKKDLLKIESQIASQIQLCKFYEFECTEILKSIIDRYFEKEQ